MQCCRTAGLTDIFKCMSGNESTLHMIAVIVVNSQITDSLQRTLTFSIAMQYVAMENDQKQQR